MLLLPKAPLIPSRLVTCLCLWWCPLENQASPLEQSMLAGISEGLWDTRALLHCMEKFDGQIITLHTQVLTPSGALPFCFYGSYSWHHRRYHVMTSTWEKVERAQKDNFQWQQLTWHQYIPGKKMGIYESSIMQIDLCYRTTAHDFWFLKTNLHLSHKDQCKHTTPIRNAEPG